MDRYALSRFGMWRAWNKSPPAIKWVPLIVLLSALALGPLACDYSAERVTLQLNVGSELVECAGVASMKCFEVNGEPFFGAIEGFDYEEGYLYRLRVERIDLYPGEEEPPEGFSRYRYRLLEVLGKTSTAPLR